MRIGVGKLIQQGTRESHHSLNVEQQSTSGCLKKKCVAVNMDQSENCMPRGSKDYEVKLAVVWKRSSM